MCVDQGVEGWLFVRIEGGRDAWGGVGPFFVDGGGVEGPENFG